MSDLANEIAAYQAALAELKVAEDAAALADSALADAGIVSRNADMAVEVATRKVKEARRAFEAAVKDGSRG